MLDSLPDGRFVLVNVVIVAAVVWGFLVSKWRTIQGGGEVWNDCWSPDPVTRRGARWAVALVTLVVVALLGWIVLRQRLLS